MSGRPTTPLLAVDVIVEIDGKVVLIERKNPPHGWAIPGGFVDVGEPLWVAATRELKEETGLDVTLECQLHTYSDPARDARGHTVSVVFLGRARPGQTPIAADDAKQVALFALDALPQLAFDHAQVLADYREYRATGRHPGATR